MKHLSIWLVIVAALVTIISCSEDNKNTTTISETAKITSFLLKGNDTVNSCTFTIDQDSFLIYNADSLTMGTSIDSLYALIRPTFYKIWINDTVDMYLYDTLWLNFENEIRYTVVAADKKTEATYTLRINRHTVDPDTLVWNGVDFDVFAGVSKNEKALYFAEKIVYLVQLGDKLTVLTSQTGSDWKTEQTVGLPSSVTNADCSRAFAVEKAIYIIVDGVLYTSPDGLAWSAIDASPAVDRLLYTMDNELYAVAKDAGTQQLVRLNGNVWQNVAALPYAFPTDGEAVAVEAGPTGISRAFVFGGIDSEGNYLNSLWSTENGTYWSNLTSGSKNLTPRADAAIAQYANHLMLFGGRDADGNVQTREMWSKDYGMTWTPMDSTKKQLPQMYVRRYGLSAVTTPAGHIYLIGGRASDDTQIADVWHGVHYASLPGFK